MWDICNLQGSDPGPSRQFHFMLESLLYCHWVFFLSLWIINRTVSGKCIKPSSSGIFFKVLLCTICWFPWYKDSQHGWFWDTKVTEQGLGKKCTPAQGDGEGRERFIEQAVLALESRKMSGYLLNGYSHREEGKCEQLSLSECICDSVGVHWCVWCVQGVCRDALGGRMLSHGPLVAPAMSLHHLPDALD